MLLTALLVLAILASATLVFTNRVELLRLAVILSLWAAVVAAFVTVIYRRQSDVAQARARINEDVFIQQERGGPTTCGNGAAATQDTERHGATRQACWTQSPQCRPATPGQGAAEWAVGALRPRAKRKGVMWVTRWRFARTAFGCRPAR